MEEFPSNSHKRAVGPAPADPKDEKKVKQVVTGKVITRKPTLTRRLGSVLFGAEAKQSWLAVAQDVILPAVRDMAADAISQGAERLIYGEPRSRPRRGPLFSGGFQGSNVSYNRYSSTSNPVGRAAGREQAEARRPISRTARATHNFDEIILATRAEAEGVLEQLFELLSRYEQVTVSDLYESVGVTGEWTDEKYGWTDLRGSDITRIREGYLLNLPKPEPIN